MTELHLARTHRGHQVAQTLVFGALGVALGVGLIAAQGTLYGLQGSVSVLARLLPFGYAYGAGMLAAVNPCGILLMPSLVAYYLGGEEAAATPWWMRAGRAIQFGAMATLGFVTLFALVGFIFAASGRALSAYFPIGGLAIGFLLAGLGVWMLVSGQSFGLAMAGRAMGAVQVTGNLPSLFFFGLAYGVASLACTLPVFLVVVGTTLARGDFLEAPGQFVGYALGMGTMLTTVIVAAAFFRSAVTRSIKGAVPYLHRLAAALLLGAGIFVIFYWLQPGVLLG
ncbi:MAG: cytochrome c biogenesis protein CcdA [Chloroflexi bacterium]|nr:cytochrome c biogenesis protein CcdA [Chloroflexota bacterium]